MKKIFFGFFLFSFLLFLLFSSPVFAEKVELEKEGYAGITELEVVFGNVVSVVTIAGGFASFIAVIIGGFKYIIAQGDPKAIAAARGTITWAIFGLAFIIFSWLILLFIEQFTGINVTKFCIGMDCVIN